MKKYCLIAKFLIAIIALVIIVFCCSYNYGIAPVSKNSTNVVVKIDDNSTYLSIADLLKDNNLIRSKAFYKIYIKIFKPQKLYAGSYNLNENMGVKKIVEELSHESNYNPNQVTLTFKEGLNIRKMASLIANNTNNTIDDVYKQLDDEEYLNDLIDTYWFIDSSILNKNMYYSLEGYLFPDTYYFNNKNVTIKEIFKVMLDEMENKLESFKNDILKSEYSVHQLLTLSSIVELEGASSNDRSSIAQVFYNRLNDNWTLGSDVTTYYAEKIDDWSIGLTNKQLNSCNSYNTRGTCFKGLPIGPICNPGLESIKATIYPTKNNDYYFVADCSGKVYLSKTAAEHDSIQAKLVSEGNWCDN